MRRKKSYLIEKITRFRMFNILDCMQKKSNIKVSFYKRNILNKTHEGYEVIMRVQYQGKRYSISGTGIYIPVSAKMEMDKVIMKETFSMNYYNNLLDILSTHFLMYCDRVIYKKQRLSAEDIRNFKFDKEIAPYAMKLADIIEDYLDERERRDTSVNHQRYIHNLQLFLDFYLEYTQVPIFDEEYFTEDLMQDFYEHLKNHYKTTTTNTIMNRITAFMNYLVRLGWIKRNPILDVRKEKVMPNRIWLPEDIVHSLYEVDLPTSSLTFARDIFLFSCFTGISFIDIKQLKWENLVEIGGDYWIKHARQKTQEPFSVFLIQQAMDIIYAQGNQNKAPQELIFPQMTSNSNINKSLKRIQEITGIAQSFSFHTARHTFATLALTHKMPIETISRVLGHTNVGTTQIYARIIDPKMRQDFQTFSRQITKQFT